METAPFDPDLGDDVMRDALAELRNHADATAATAETPHDEQRSQEISAMADELEGRMPPPPAPAPDAG